MREETQLRIVVDVIKTFKGDEPLSRFLKKYFNLNRQLGSRDRRLIQQYTYSYFRIGKLYSDYSIEERLALASKVCSLVESPFQKFIGERFPNIQHLTSNINLSDIFSFSSHLSSEIDKNAFVNSFLHQPKVWIRVIEKFSSQVEKELLEKNILFEKDVERKDAWSFISSVALDKLDSFQKGYFEIQDYSSQKTIDFIQPNANETWWDACAGAGGKGLMMADKEPTINLICTDSRETILQNLKERFQKAAIRQYSTQMLDLLNSNFKLKTSSPIDGIVADVPCTGSGTWSRTPEWNSFFDERSIEKYQTLQRKILSVIATFLVEGKPLVYITCSVFKEENERNVAWVTTNLPLKLQTQQYIQGASKGADTMFAARFIKF